MHGDLELHCLCALLFLGLTDMVVHGLQQPLDVLVLILVELENFVCLELVLAVPYGPTYRSTLGFGIGFRIVLHFRQIFQTLAQLVWIILSSIAWQTALAFNIVSVAVATIAVVCWSCHRILFDLGRF